LEIPAWMFDRAARAAWRVGAAPYVDIAVLTATKPTGAATMSSPRRALAGIDQLHAHFNANAYLKVLAGGPN
jgi:hypothetical protein